ncbi:MAG TPA: hypothetical protein VN578_19085 [Candidatus Binatia bacterium]|jgi:hypothetical protein|nr:hypothetical protein [Candidatus Binatia bacterium]
MKRFGQVLDSADELSSEEQESLIAILQRRLSDRRRADLVNAVKEARREFKEGTCRPAVANQILKRILR